MSSDTPNGRTIRDSTRPDLRLANRAELATLIDEVLATDGLESWLRRFDDASIPAGPVQNVAQALEHEQSRAVRHGRGRGSA